MTLDEADSFGKRVRYYRNKLGISTYKLAHIMGLTHNTITQTELGRFMPNVPRIQAYAKALGVKAGALFPDEWTPEQRQPYPRKRVQSARQAGQTDENQVD